MWGDITLLLQFAFPKWLMMLEHIFMYLLLTCKSSLEKYLSDPLPIFKLNCWFYFLILRCVSSLYILDISPLSNVPLFPNIFPIKIVVFSFCWWFPFLCKSFLVWCSPICCIFAFVALILADIFPQIWLRSMSKFFFYFFLKVLWFQGLTFKSLIYEFILYMV